VLARSVTMKGRHVSELWAARCRRGEARLKPTINAEARPGPRSVAELLLVDREGFSRRRFAGAQRHVRQPGMAPCG
jgi:hypothetical protein